RRVILDLGAVEFMDSSGLGAIVALLKRIGRDGDLVLAGTRPAVRKLLQITRIDRILTQHATVDEAARALGAGSPAA
ncbi:MAG TPA: anti-sigma factor antagonist, partial [Vineibacter sp.]|nr:anti-sigma factor antagonist [Vineibacter sp.]